MKVLCSDKYFFYKNHNFVGYKNMVHPIFYCLVQKAKSDEAMLLPAFEARVLWLIFGLYVPMNKNTHVPMKKNRIRNCRWAWHIKSMDDNAAAT